MKAPAFWQIVIKRMLDIFVALTGLLLLLPLFIYIAIRIKLDSTGPVFYSQERIGYRGIPFIIFKFRSMFENAEQGGPRLSSEQDHRITSLGKMLRKWKLDELPQLWNILLGNMSLVGPRPERKYYIDQVSAKFPYFSYLHQVKPGLTSLGMIRFGYAKNIEQITERLKFEIEYIETYSLPLDFKIIYLTLHCIIKGNTLAHISRPRSSERFKKLTILDSCS